MRTIYVQYSQTAQAFGYSVTIPDHLTDPAEILDYAAEHCTGPASRHEGAENPSEWEVDICCLENEIEDMLDEESA